jgi:hypothetical protein
MTARCRSYCVSQCATRSRRSGGRDRWRGSGGGGVGTGCGGEGRRRFRWPRLRWRLRRFVLQSLRHDQGFHLSTFSPTREAEQSGWSRTLPCVLPRCGCATKKPKPNEQGKSMRGSLATARPRTDLRGTKSPMVNGVKRVTGLTVTESGMSAVIACRVETRTADAWPPLCCHHGHGENHHEDSAGHRWIATPARRRGRDYEAALAVRNHDSSVIRSSPTRRRRRSSSSPDRRWKT